MEVARCRGAPLPARAPCGRKPTWGVYWDWDPRLTTTAILVCAFAGILALRSFIDDTVKRATWSAVAAIIASADVPIVYFSVRWWNSLHQVQIGPATVSRALPLAPAPQRVRHPAPHDRLIVLRRRIASCRLEAEMRAAARKRRRRGGRLMESA